MKQGTKLLIVNFVGIILCGIGMIKTVEAQVKIGAFADCQYCNCEPVGNRYYQNSLEKLNNCISDFNNEKDIDFVVGLGDLIDRDFTSFEKVNAILKQSKNKVYQITGNHDYSVEPNLYSEVPKQLNLKNTYYSFESINWKFIFLDGNDITFNSNDKTVIKQAEKMLAELTSTNQPNDKDWNGGIGKTQVSWLNTQLKNAEEKNLKVVLFCHYPLLPLEAHTLWNSKEILTILNNHSCVKAWINGHNHAGGYAKQNNIHFITLKGMVDTKTENAYSYISFGEKEINITGIGREESRKLVAK